MGLHRRYEIEYQGKRVAVFHPGVGAPLAAKKFIACGGAGVLGRETFSKVNQRKSDKRRAL